MRILFFGDIVGRVGRTAISNSIDKLVSKYHIDFVIANGENATHGKGLIEKHYNFLIDCGINCITLGNHYLSKNDIVHYIDDANCIVRPLNLKTRFGGVGSALFEVDGIKIRVTNLLGTAFMSEEVISPYLSLKELIESIDGEDSIHIVDYHGEATSEKISFGYLFDGIVSAVFGTHTHVQTNDAKILPNGTAFMCDVGMCGYPDGVIGFEKNSVLNKVYFGSEEKFVLVENGREMINGVVIDIDEISKKCREIFTINLIGECNGK